MLNGDYEACESIIQQASNEHLFDHYISMRDYEPKWSLICAASDSSNDEDKPGMRGGHQMCIDPDNGKMLF